MNKRVFWPMVIVIVIIAIIIFGVYWYRLGNVPSLTKDNNANASTSDMILVDTPLPNVFVQSPVTVTGKARGGWYFEASFPVKVFDANGNQLGATQAQAQGDWMTQDFVPFKAILEFATSSTENGTVILEKDNPSGLPQNSASVSIPVYFSNNASKL